MAASRPESSGPVEDEMRDWGRFVVTQESRWELYRASIEASVGTSNRGGRVVVEDRLGGVEAKLILIPAQTGL